MIKNKVELLAPAGTYQCFTAALKGGADAVYLGLDRFGARANAGNFTYEELYEALDTAHILGKKIYLTVNTVFKDDEVDELYDFIVGPYEHGLDGVIVQDIGVISYIKENFPLLDVHASTQMTITDCAGVEFVSQLGVTRCVPSRELTLAEIKKMHDETGMELECFIHGAMCYSYSGKCLYSSFLGDRSGNRGRCAQPCRLTYNDCYLLSMKDMCTIDIIPQLIEAGIMSFKIEGRMKSPDYVYGVTSIYRKYIDKYYNGQDYYVEKSDKERLLATYTRSGNCEGYYNQKNGRNMITINSPSYNSEKYEQTASDSDLKVPERDAAIKCRIMHNKPIEVSLSFLPLDGSNEKYEYSYVSDEYPDKALKLAASVENVTKQLVKTGGTGINITSCNVEIDDGLFIPNAVINKVRRTAVDGAKEDYLMRKYYRNRQPYNLQKEIVDIDSGINDNKDIVVSVLDGEQFRCVLNHNCITGVIVPLVSAEDIIFNSGMDSIISDRIESGIDIYVSLPYIIREHSKCISQSELVDLICKLNSEMYNRFGKYISGYYFSNYESLNILKKNNIKGKYIADLHVYALNREAFNYLKKYGVSNMTVPVELSKGELIKRGIIGEELIVYGRIPMMISTQCIKKTTDGCKYSSKGHMLYINDRKHVQMPVYCNCVECTGVIYNSVPLSIYDETDFIKRINPSVIRLNFTDETTSDINNILSKIDKSELFQVKLCDNYTKGHLRKGVM